MTVDSAEGRVRVAINGVILIDASGVNTNPAGSGTVDRVGFTAKAADYGAYTMFDDFYLADGLGGAGDDLEEYGDVWVGTDQPNSDDSVAWSRSGGATNYENVDEPQEDGDATYNSSATVGATDIFGCPGIDVPAAGTVLGVQVSAVVKKAEAGTREFAVLVKSGATESEGPRIGPGLGYQVFSHLSATNPDGGGAWNLETAGAAKIGIRVKS